MSRVIAPRISTDRFDYSPERKEFHQDISMLSHSGIDIFSRLYDDAADQGFILKSHITGKELTFHLVNESRDGDGDVKFWVYELVPGVYDPKVMGATVVVLND